MYRVKWYSEEGIFEASGGASANSLFFENQLDHELFLQLWNRFMGSYAQMLHYSLTEVSWAIVFRTKSKDVILSQHEIDRQKSKKRLAKDPLIDVGRILSKRMRLFLSNYVAMSNRALGKSGSRVKKRFNKFGFMDVVDYEERIELLEGMKQLYVQEKEPYRADESYYDEEHEMGFCCRYRSAKPYYSGYLQRHFCVDDFQVVDFDSTVLRLEIEKTFTRFLNSKNQNNSPPNS